MPNNIEIMDDEFSCDGCDRDLKSGEIFYHLRCNPPEDDYADSVDFCIPCSKTLNKINNDFNTYLNDNRAQICKKCNGYVRLFNSPLFYEECCISKPTYYICNCKSTFNIDLDSLFKLKKQK